MFFRIEPDNGVAIYDQIARQVKYAIANGALRAGELVPSVRELAMLLTVNPNTVARAYRDLQNESVLETMRGEGLRVSRQAVDRCRKARQRLLEDRMSAVATEALQGGFSEEEFYALARTVWSAVRKQGAATPQNLQ